MADYVKAIAVADLAPGQCKEVLVAGRAVALYNVGGVFHATTNTCLHRGGPLGQGFLEGNVVTCPWHGWTFDVTSGANTVNPEMTVETFEVKVEGGDVLVKVG
jgi:nitrite reductase/ring-hydroxylating ferredoxin subunit